MGGNRGKLLNLDGLVGPCRFIGGHSWDGVKMVVEGLSFRDRTKGRFKCVDVLGRTDTVYGEPPDKGNRAGLLPCPCFSRIGKVRRLTHQSPLALESASARFGQSGPILAPPISLLTGSSLAEQRCEHENFFEKLSFTPPRMGGSGSRPSI